MTWQDIAAKKVEERLQKIPPEWRIPQALLPKDPESSVRDWPNTSGFFTAEELHITNLTASEVFSALAQGNLTAEDVTRAVCKRAAAAQQLLNCLTEICFEDAITRAKELDEYFHKHGKVMGPLHGLPISLKDQFNVRGYDSTMGYISRANNPASDDSTLVDLLKSAGAIVYCKTNVPATLMMFESVNNLWGQTANPWNRKLTPGGSSGGESALVSFGGSFLGIGTDIGGSIRTPYGRISYQSAENTMQGQEAIRSTAGPMCRSPSDIRLFMTAVLDQQPWYRDPQVLPIPWRTEEEKLPAKLCFGFAYHDGKVGLSPPLTRAMDMTKAALMAAGHEVIEFVPYEHYDVVKIDYDFLEADGGEEFRRDTDASGEPLHPQIESWLGHSAKVVPQTVFETWQNQHRRTLLATKWLDRWQATKDRTSTGRPIDGLIIPVGPLPAFGHGRPWMHSWGSLAPLLDLTTGVFPVTKVDPEKDVIPSDWQPISLLDEKIMECYETPKNHENAPVGLALTGRRLEEEKITAMLALIEDCLKVSS
ncbi:general amidase protein [Rutstroemia sp. NJR-2017a BBW]|nr:general amidase protein [Rutstroemia sp. NJR-2017a BBW]